MNRKCFSTDIKVATAEALEFLQGELLDYIEEYYLNHHLEDKRIRTICAAIQSLGCMEKRNET